MQRLLVLSTLLVSTAASAEPAVNRSSIVFHLVPHNHKPEWTWTPSIRFKVSGPLASSTTVGVEYTLPNGRPFLKATCDQTEIAGTSTTFTDCGYRQDDAIATNLTGQFGFQIKLADPLAGSPTKTTTLFTGKMTVGKQLYNPTKQTAGNKQFYYYVDQDWRLPFGFVGTHLGDIGNNVFADLWIKGPIPDTSQLKGYLFFNGKQVAETSGSLPVRATPPDTPAWEYHLVQLKFPALTDKPVGESNSYRLYENPGTYEIKLLRANKLVRTLKFTIGSDGKPADTGAAARNGLPAGALVPVVVLDGDGSWRKDAWKTEAFFGNPVGAL